MTQVLASSGFDALDAALGGVYLGDNVVLRARTADAPMADVAAGFAAAPGYEARHAIRFARSGTDAEELTKGDATTMATATLATARGLGTGSLIVFGDLAPLVSRVGADAAVRYFSAVCPALLRIGAVAVWVLGVEVPDAVADEIARITQVVLGVGDDVITLERAEARAAVLVGATVRITRVGDELRLEEGETPSPLGASLVALRRQRELSQQEVARLAGVSASAISQAERGRRGLSLTTLIRLASALGVTLDDLVLGGEAATYRIRGRTSPHRAGASRAALVDGDAYRLHEFRLDPGTQGSPPANGRGHEVVLLGQGLLLVELSDGSTPVIREGEALLADQAAVTGWRNLADDEAVGFWFSL